MTGRSMARIVARWLSLALALALALACCSVSKIAHAEHAPPPLQGLARHRFRLNDLALLPAFHGQIVQTGERIRVVRAEDLGDYYRISSDSRDLNYALYFEKGEKKVTQFEDYTSANTHQLSDEELRDLLLKLDYIQQELVSPNSVPAAAGK